MSGVLNAMASAVNNFTGRRFGIYEEPTARVEINPRSTLSGAETRALVDKLGRFSAEDMHRSQPNLRSVVDFCARNTAQLGLHLYRPVEAGRERDRDSDASKLLGEPSKAQSDYDLIYGLVADLALYDEAFWVVTKAGFMSSGWTIRPIPVMDVVHRHGSEWDGSFSVDVILDDEKVRRIPAENLIHFRGWSPDYKSHGTPPIDSLKGTLIEQVAAQSYRLSVWKNGGLVSSYISRPQTAANWSEGALQRFYEAMDRFKLGGTKQGGMPVLEDGMKIESTALNSKEQQYVESSQLSLATVARAFHVNPAMLGETGGITYANMREFRKGLYGETLGPLLSKIEATINLRLLPMVGAQPGTYAEFNVKEKLRGSFEEEASVLSTATGGVGWMTPNEARGTQNLTPVEGGDQLYQRSPRGSTDTVGEDTAPPDEAKAITTKRRVSIVSASLNDAQDALLQATIADHAARQRATVLSMLGDGKKAVKSDWWDTERWDRELTTDLYRVATAVTDELGTGITQKLGAPGTWDAEATRAFLWAVAETRAHMLNEGTRKALLDTLNSDTPDTGAVFDDLADERGARWAHDVGIVLAGFAVVEAGKHLTRRGEKTVRKTWLRTKTNSRDTHRALHGQTVGIDEKFSNGADWPGDAILPTGEVANCGCIVEIAVTDA